MSHRVAFTAAKEPLWCREIGDVFFRQPQLTRRTTHAMQHARAWYLLPMTRKQVAARLGRSVATVRRLEGSQLHPVLDANGVHRFDPREVEAVARGIERPRAFRRFAVPEVTLQEPNGGGGCIACSRLHDQVKRLEAELDDIGRNSAKQLDDLRASHEQAITRAATEQRALESALSELLEALED